MTNQLLLIDTPSTNWRLDDDTKAIGREGIAEARRVLQLAQQSAAAKRLQQRPSTDDALADKTTTPEDDSDTLPGLATAA